MIDVIRRKYRYYMSFDDGATFMEFVPSSGAKLVEKKEDDYEFMRLELDSDIEISNNYTEYGDINSLVFIELLKRFYNEGDHYKKIILQIKNGESVWFEASFGVNQGELKSENGTYKIKPKVKDKYHTIFEYFDTEYDVLDDSLTTHDWIYSEKEQDMFGGGRYWILYFPATGYEKRIYTHRDYWSHIWLHIDESQLEAYIVTKTFQRNLLVKDVIQFILNQIATKSGTTALTFQSDLLNNTLNYITSENPNPLNSLKVAQITDYFLYDGLQSSDPATIGKMSLKMILDFLCRNLNGAWWIDETNHLIFEHITRTNITSSWIDLNDKSKYPKESTTIPQNYEYPKEMMPNQEKWKFINAWNDEFVGKPIIYNEYESSNSEDSNEKIRSCEGFTTDLNNLWWEQENIDSNGFVMVCDQQYPLDDHKKPNYYLSIENLHELYWRENRIQLSGNMNGVDTTFNSQIRKRTHKVQFKFNDTDGCPTDKLVITPLLKFNNIDFVAFNQVGQVAEKLHDLDTDFIELKLSYSQSDIY